MFKLEKNYMDRTFWTLLKQVQNKCKQNAFNYIVQTEKILSQRLLMISFFLWGEYILSFSNQCSHDALRVVNKKV